MAIIQRYLLKTYLVPFGAGIFLFLTIGWLSEILDKLSSFTQPGVKFYLILCFLALQTPHWLIQTLPVSMLLASLFSLGQLTYHHEITALRASGISWVKILSPFIFFALFISLLSFFINETIVPQSNGRANYIYRIEICKENPPNNLQANNLVVSGKNNSQFMIDFLDVKDGIMQGVLINWYNPDFQLTTQIYAQEGKWENNHWIFFNVIERNFSRLEIKEKKFLKKETQISEPPHYFLLTAKKIEEMNFFQLKNYIARLKNLGRPSPKEEFELHLKIAYPLANLIIILIGLPFGLIQRRSGSRTVSFGISIFISFIYWGIVISVGKALAENKILSPILAAWLGNIVFGLIGLGFLGRIKGK